MTARFSRTVESIGADTRRGFGAPFEDILIGALVALPFSGTLAILLAAVGIPGEVATVFAGLAQGVGTFWIAGMRHRQRDR